MSFADLDYVRHILDETRYLQTASAGLEQTKFIRDETLRRAFVRSIGIIGEAARHVSEQFQNKYPAIEWRSMAGMRNRLIHNYLGVDYDIVWDVVTNKVPALRNELERVLQQESRTQRDG
ncbi:MAG: hypothetical protein DME33_01745 [Verrucomicrobia bacterium]|nr:MAG: hypothetical protein DME33_01745 [Verrucomicrobiota bacterium]